VQSFSLARCKAESGQDLGCGFDEEPLYVAARGAPACYCRRATFILEIAVRSGLIVIECSVFWVIFLLSPSVEAMLCWKAKRWSSRGRAVGEAEVECPPEGDLVADRDRC